MGLIKYPNDNPWMIIKNLIERTKFLYVFPMSKICKNKQRSNDPPVWLLSVNIWDYIQWLYSKFIASMLAQINWVNAYGTQ